MERDPGSLYNLADSTMEAAPEKIISINIIEGVGPGVLLCLQSCMNV